MEKKTICVDFDGVIAQYDGFKGNDIFGDPIDGVQSAMEVLKKKGFTIIIFTTRTASSKLKKYLNDNHITYDYINENFEKAFDNYKKMTKEYALCNS